MASAAKVGPPLSATRATIVPEIITALGGKRAIYSLVLSTVIGTTVFHSFIGGPIQYKTLPRANFGNLQSKIFPTYFAIQGVGAAVCLGMWHYGHRMVRFDRNAFRFNAWLLGGMVVGAVANLVSVDIMMQRHRLEKTEGKKYTDADVSPAMKELSSKFAVAHSVSALLNLGVLLAAVTHSAWIAEYASAL
ncbi:hypothetical protein RQP46_009520 [Phenoliferia psychrophenolica]